MQSNILYDRLEQMRGIPLLEEEKHEIDMWNRGRALAQIFPTEGYQEVLAILQSYATDQIEKLVNTDVADKDNILAFHAMAHTAGKIFSNFVQDVAAAVEASRTTPDCVKQGLKAGPVPVESN
jgi:hypothetical protein